MLGSRPGPPSPRLGTYNKALSQYPAMEDLDLAPPPEPAAAKRRIQSRFSQEIERNQQPAAHPKASNRMEYSTGFRSAVVEAVTDALWDEWQADLEAADLSRAELAELVALSTYVALSWAHGDMEWEYLLEDVGVKLENAEAFLE